MDNTTRVFLAMQCMGGETESCTFWLLINYDWSPISSVLFEKKVFWNMVTYSNSLFFLKAEFGLFQCSFPKISFNINTPINIL